MPERITLTSKSGTPLEGEIALPRGDMKAPGVVLIQEWWGLNGHVRSLLDRLATAGFIALAPDLYHGVVTNDAGEAEGLMKAMNWDKALDEIGGAAAYLHAHERCIGQVGVTGFCLGGALTFATATHYPDLISAAVPFYGIPPAPARADFSKVRAPIMAHFASRDQWATPEAAQAIKEELEGRGQTMELHVYDAGHAFVNDTRSDVYNPEAARLAWKRTVDFLHKNLG
ncbi:MAG TPA: dienelactone hydrolase family protein [Polyangiaceae bacterium]|jgi:carboxymethylenebutenolidase|nr:dienelactone hydrolase family protein [Polyangiaceae bacterium]